MEHHSRDEKKPIDTKDEVGLLLEEAVSTKKTDRGKGCGWLASLGEVVSTKKHTHHCKGCGWLTIGR